LLGKGVVPDEHPYTTGGLGLLGTGPSVEVMDDCDALFIIGSSFPYMEYLPKPGEAKGVQIDDKADRIGLRFPMDVGLVGDAKATLRMLIPWLQEKEDQSWIQKAQKSMKEWWEIMQIRETHGDSPIKPQRVAYELSKLAKDDCIISTDSGTITCWVARHFRMRGAQQFSCSGTLATMAPALPYTIAAQIAYPDRQCIAFIGDGGFTMLMGDFATAVKYDLPIVVVVIKNNVLGQIKWEQIVFLGNPEYGVDLQPIDFAKFAEACGGVGIAVDRPEDIAPALEKALSLKKPCVVEVTVDPFEPPMPPKVTVQQALHFTEALTKGQPHGPRIALTLFRDKVAELF
jgi:pyruvate dehydrogenase (quinone)/pyruvate oxidase